MEIIFSPQAMEDLDYWKKSGNKIIQKKIQQLIESIQETPFEGIGKPEGLKHQHSGRWSRRINQEHRLVYKVEDQTIIITALRYHY
ncbi:Txe/YoeB family addiction module toxin [Mucilaginibacter sp.]|uniref:Txe/YoeB family addiction module toxin n=1 Tax=Mucilaginibacter sp. TaxID=1882438 RepID=UPI0025E9D13D|nr:Txe/YoeB family addiction module toxin [Mucilaginibacter sp.]